MEKIKYNGKKKQETIYFVINKEMYKYDIH